MPSYGDMLRELREALQRIQEIADKAVPDCAGQSLRTIIAICDKVLEVPPTRTPK